MHNRNTISKGFTLLEILLVIAAIGILAAIVIVAINPQRQLAQVRDTERQSNVNTIHKALEQYLIQEGSYPMGITNSYQDVCNTEQTVDCVDISALVPVYLASIPTDDSGRRYQVAIHPDNDRVSIITSPELEGEIGINTFNDQSGASESLAASSCQAILESGASTGDGVYWIDLPTSGPTQTYCVMDTDFDGGGWMLALKATRGTTFEYYSPYWTTPNTLNPEALDLTDGDAKFEVMNRYEAKDMLAIWPDIQNGGSIPSSTRGWTWLQNDFYGGVRIVPITFWDTVDRYFIGDANLFSGWASGIFTSQISVRFYGFNYRSLGTDTRARWGFGWNENSPVALFPDGDENSPDAAGGLGLVYRGGNRYSAGDVNGCCTNTNGINRSARVELYIR